MYLYCTGKPGPPRHLEAVSISNDSVQLVWDTPCSEGGAPITNYVIEKRDGHRRSMWNGVGTTERTTFTAGKVSNYATIHGFRNHCFRTFMSKFQNYIQEQRDYKFPNLPLGVHKKLKFKRFKEVQLLVLNSAFHPKICKQFLDGVDVTLLSICTQQALILNVNLPCTGKLYEDNEYYFRVAAENAVGISDFVELTTAVRPKPPFSKYTMYLIVSSQLQTAL